MRRLALVLALSGSALSGCAALLGVEDVVLDGAGGGGGATSSSESASLGVGAGFAVSGSASQVASTGTDAVTSTGSGLTCEPDLPPCAGAVGNSFEEDSDLEDFWMIERRRADVKGKKLELDPDESSALIRSSATIATGAACAVWITLLSVEQSSSSAGIAVGSGAPGAEWLSVYRAADAVVTGSQGQVLGSLPLSDPGAPHVLRLRFDGAGSVAADVKSEGGCYLQVGAAAAGAGEPPSVLVFQVGEGGKSQLDDYCL